MGSLSGLEGGGNSVSLWVLLTLLTPLETVPSLGLQLNTAENPTDTCFSVRRRQPMET